MTKHNVSQALTNIWIRLMGISQKITQIFIQAVPYTRQKHKSILLQPYLKQIKLMKLYQNNRISCPFEIMTQKWWKGSHSVVYVTFYRRVKTENLSSILWVQWVQWVQSSQNSVNVLPVSVTVKTFYLQKLLHKNSLFISFYTLNFFPDIERCECMSQSTNTNT